MLKPAPRGGRNFVRAALTGLWVLGTPVPSAGQDVSWGFVEYGHTDVDAVDGRGHGEVLQARLPLSPAWFISAEGQRVEKPLFAATDKVLQTGLGVHSTGSWPQAFAVLSYQRETRTEQDEASGITRERLQGFELEAGDRWLVGGRVVLEAAGGVGAVGHPFLARIKVAGRLAPYLWAVGGYTMAFDSYSWLAGLRLAFGDPRPRRPGARAFATAPPSEAASPPAWQPGQHLVAQRELLLQRRPLRGAAEVGKIPAGATIVLRGSESTDTGLWWRVVAGDQEGWIRESWLK